MEIRQHSSTWYDVLSFLSLAAVLGLVSGVALGAVALLLAAPAYGADSGQIKEGALLAAGAWQSGRGAWIQAKAVLAQVLIAQAWSRTLNGEAKVKPWPWADTWPVAKLAVPRLGLEYYVLEGADGSAIAFGPGHALSVRRTARRRTPALRAASLLELIELQDLDAGRGCPGIAVRLDLVVERGLLLTADLLKGFPHVGIEAGAVTERRVEDMFHAVSCAGVTDSCKPARPALQSRVVSPDYRAAATPI